MAVDFPSSPNVGDTVTDPDTGAVWVWDGTKWTHAPGGGGGGGGGGEFLPLTGGTISGDLRVDGSGGLTVANSINSLAGLSYFAAGGTWGGLVGDSVGNLWPTTDGQTSGAQCGIVGNAWFRVASYDWDELSDPALKKDVADPTEALAIVNAIGTKLFRWKDRQKSSDPLHWGFMATDVAAVMGPDYAVHRQDEKTGIHSLGFNEMIAVLWEAVRELSVEVERLKAKV
jgi:hypothetical protein